MKNKKQILSIFAISMVLLMLASVSADCKISFISKIDSYPTTNFEAGIISQATANYDPAYDVLQPGMPASKYLQIRTNVKDNFLVKDFRNSLPQTWQIIKVAIDSSSQGLSGTDSLTWTIDCPDDLELTLIDFGLDASRKNAVKTINLKETSLYITEINKAVGPYRYVDLIAKQKSICTENWECKEWSKCKKQEQTRACKDLNKCETSESKPVTTRTCDSGDSNKPAITLSSSEYLTSSEYAEVIKLDTNKNVKQDNVIRLISNKNTTNKNVILLNSKSTTPKSFLSKLRDFFSRIV